MKSFADERNGSTADEAAKGLKSLLDSEVPTTKDVRMNRNSERRFGFSIKFEQYRTSNLIKVVCITLAIIIIPLEIFVQHVL